MSALNNSALLGASGSQGYQISRSVRLRSSASAYFNRTPASAGNRRTWTWSAWVKRGDISTAENPLFTGYTDANNRWYARFEQNTLRFYWNVAGTSNEVYTNAVFRDPSAWYHVVVAVDTTQATDSNRIKVYVNGVQQTLSGTYIPQNTDTQWNNNVVQTIGKKDTAGTYFDGYLTEINSIDGQQLTPSSFGETNPVTGVWQPKKYTGTYGTNGFYLNFSDNSAATAAAIGKDYSGNGNNWTPNNISVTAGVTYDSMLDVPTQWADGGNGRGNYATLSPIDNNNGTLSSGNLNLSIPAGTSSSGFGNFAMTAGKWYWEVIPTNGSVFASFIGVSDQSAAATNRTYTTTNGWGYYSNAQTYYNNTPASYGATFTTNDVIGVAYDADIGSLSFYKNGVSQGVAFSTNLFGKPIIPAFFNGTSSNAQTFVANFGQRPFTYTPPTGFKALNTLNLPTPTILKGNQYMDATTYTGTGVTRSVTNSGSMQPDLVWVKTRSISNSHQLTDSVRGASLALASDLTLAEYAGEISAFNSNGFQVTGGANATNGSGVTYVGWQWKEGATQGFDIVTYTGTGANRTIAHNLGVAPSMIIFRARSIVENWPTWHKNLTAADYVLTLNTTNAQASVPSVMNSTAPTSSVFSVGTSAGSNSNGATYVAYLFSEVAGYSKFGSYTGNGSTDGTFVYTGFRPRWVLIKCSSAAGTGWYVYDTVRNTYNVMDLYLRPDVSDAETTFTTLDCLSNGFKLRTSNSQFNGSGSTYIFAAFAENPFKNALAR